MGKVIQLDFKLNGINQAITGVDTLEQKVGSLGQTFKGTVDSGNESIKEINSSLTETGNITDETSSKLDNFGQGLIEGAGEAGKVLDETKNKVVDLGDSLDEGSDKGKTFGQGLENSAKGGSLALKGLSGALKLVGVDVGAIKDLSDAFKSLFQLLHGQAKLSEVVTGTDNIKDQATSMGTLSKESKVLASETEVLAGAQVTNAEATATATVATEGASVATRVLGTVMKALPIFAIIAGIALLVEAFNALTGATKRASEEEARRIKTVQDSLAIQEQALNAQKELNQLRTEEGLVPLQKQLELLQSMPNTLKEQFEVQKQIIAKTNEGLTKQIEDNKELLKTKNDQAKAGRENLALAEQNLATEEKSLKNKYLGKTATFGDGEKAKLAELKTARDEAEKARDQASIEADKLAKENSLLETKRNESQNNDLKILQNQTREKLIQQKIEQENLIIDLKKKGASGSQSTQKINDDTDKVKNKLIEERIGFELEEAKTVEQVQEAEQNRLQALSIGTAQAIADINQKRDEDIKASDESIQAEIKASQDKIKLGNLTQKEKQAEIDFIRIKTTELGEKQVAIAGKAQADIELLNQQSDQRILKEKQDSLNKQSAIANDEFDKTLNAVQKKESDYSELVKNGGLFRIKAIKDEQEKIFQAIKDGVDKDIAEQERLRSKELASAKDNKEVGIINKKYDDIEQIIKDKGEKANEDAKKLFSGTAKEIVAQAQALVNGLKSIYDALVASQLADIQAQEDAINTLNDQQQQAFDESQARLDAEIQATQDAESAKEQIISDTQSRINSLEDEFSKSKGKRHAFLLTLIEAEQIKLKNAQKEKDKIAKHNEEIEKQKVIEQEKRDAEEQVNKDKIAQLEKERKKKELEQQQVSAIINVAGGIANALNNPFPVNLIFAGIVAVAGAIQLATIEKEKSRLKKGGLVSGNSHEQGGVTGTGAFNNVEVEGGEFVINRESTLANKDILQEINTNKGKRFALASKFADGGQFSFAQPNFVAIQDSLSASQSNITGLADVVVQAVKNIPPSQVSVTEINEVNKRVTKIQEYSKI